MNSSILKTTTDINQIYEFLKEKKFIEQEATDVIQEHLEGKKHKHFEISSDGGLMAIIVYSDDQELKDAEKELKTNISVDYLFLIKSDYSEYRFYKNDPGTGKTLKLKKKKEELEQVFLKK